MSYTPRATVKIILDGMAAQDHKMEWGTKELAELGGISEKAVSSTVKTALREGRIFRQKRGVATYWSLTSYEGEVEPEPFNAAMYLDGDLVIHSVPINEDGSFTIAKANLDALKKLLAWSPA